MDIREQPKGNNKAANGSKELLKVRSDDHPQEEVQTQSLVNESDYGQQRPLRKKSVFPMPDNKSEQARENGPGGLIRKL